MNFSYNYFQQLDSPELRLCNPDGRELAVINARERNIALRLNDISELTFTVPSKLSDTTGAEFRPLYYDQLETKRLIYVTYIGWFVITDVTEQSDGQETYKSITCESHESSFKLRGFLSENRVYCVYNPLDPCDSQYMSSNASMIPSVVGQLYQQLGIVSNVSTTDEPPTSDYNVWTIDYVNPSFVYHTGDSSNVCRTFKENTTNGYDFIANDFQNAFDAVVIFDFMHHAIKIKTVDEITHPSDVYLSFDNVIKQIEIKENSDDIRTVLTCKGTDLDIYDVNPTGTGYIVDFSNYVGDTIYHSCHGTSPGALQVVDNASSPTSSQITQDATGIQAAIGSYVNASKNDNVEYKWMSGELSSLLKNWNIDVDKSRSTFASTVSSLRSELRTRTEQDAVIQKYNLRIDSLNTALAQYMQYASQNVAPLFSSTDTYTIGDCVKYRGDFYKCIANITTSGSWSPDKWEAIGIGDTKRLLVETINVGDTSIRSGTIFATNELNPSYSTTCYKNAPSVSFTATNEVASKYEWDSMQSTSNSVELSTAYSNSTPMIYFPDVDGTCYYKLIGSVIRDVDGDILYEQCISTDSGALLVIADAQTPMSGQICKSATKLSSISIGNYVKVTYGIGSVEVYATYSDIASWVATYEQARASIQSDISTTDGVIEGYRATLSSFADELNLINYVSRNDNTLINELMCYWSEGEYINENLEVLDSTTYEERIDMATQLMTAGKEQLSKICKPKYSFTLDAYDFMKMYELRGMMSALELGSVVTTENTNNGHYYPAVTKIDFSLDEVDSFQLTFSNALRFDDWGYTYADLITESAATSQNVISNWKQLTSYARERDTIQSIIKNPLDKSFSLGLSNMYNQEFAIDATGIIGRQYTDDSHGSFNSEQLRIINNQILFTDDGWQTIKSALGKIVYDNQTYYGLVGEAIIGSLLVGDTLKIKNDESSVIIDGNGIIIKHDNNTVFNADISGNASLLGTITSTSGYIGGWSIDDNTLTSGNSGLTSTYAKLSSNPSDIYAIAIGNTDASEDTTAPFRVSRNGTLYASGATISGSIYANGGSFNNCTIYDTCTVECVSFADEHNNYFVKQRDTDSFFASNGGTLTMGVEERDSEADDKAWVTVESTVGVGGSVGSHYACGIGAKYDATDTTDIEQAFVQCIVSQTDNSLRPSHLKLSSTGNILIHAPCIAFAREENILSLLGNTTYEPLKILIKEYSSSGADSSLSDRVHFQGNLQLGYSASANGNVAYSGSSNNTTGELQGTWTLNGSSLATTSDQRFKNSIEILTQSYTDLFDNLVPRRYKLNDSTSDRYHTGFIAQEVKEAVLTSGMTSLDAALFTEGQSENEYWGIRYEEIIPLCVNEIQKLKRRVTELENSHRDVAESIE